jgi:Flp pilus assembly protein TadD
VAARAAEAPAAGPTVPAIEGCRSALLRQRARDALANCRQVFASDPRSADAMVLLARADLLAGRPAETLQLAHRAVSANPRHADAYLLIGTVQQVEGRRSEARSAYETYLQLAPLGAHATDVKAILRTL